MAALDEDDNAVVVRQFRAGEEPIACARRELKEETGYRAECFVS